MEGALIFVKVKKKDELLSFLLLCVSLFWFSRTVTLLCIRFKLL